MYGNLQTLFVFLHLSFFTSPVVLSTLYYLESPGLGVQNSIIESLRLVFVESEGTVVV